jgi:hypothetical protein
MLRSIKSEKAQAAVELAIIASIIILAFSSLINFTEKINRTQAHMQDVFRRQLISAYGSGASHTTRDLYYRAPNIIDPLVPGELVYLPGSTGKVLWNSHGGGTDAEVGWDDSSDNGKDFGKIEYTKTLRRTENPGSFPVTQRTVTYYDAVAGRVITRSGP